MNTLSKRFTPFLEKISKIDLDKFYTIRNRIFCHVFMWGFFSLLLFLNYSVEWELSLKYSSLLTIRGVVNNMIVFYIFFYIVVPQIFKSKGYGILILVLSVPLLIPLWLATNHLQFSLLHFFNLEIHDGALKDIVSRNASQTFAEAISYKNILGNAMPVIYSFSASFFVKILFDITRLFNRTIYFQKQTLDLELENLNIEKDFLKAQLNPHFLFNTLNNLYGLVVKKDSLAPEIIINISNLMAYTLYESNTDKVPLEKELNFIENYFSLEKIRYSESKDITLEVFAPKSVENLTIAPLLTFVFIENAFKYGLKGINENFLNINISIVDNIFYFSIVNNKEINAGNKKHLGGIGVKNIEKRLNLIYPQENHELIIEDRGSSFFVSLSINLDYNGL